VNDQQIDQEGNDMSDYNAGSPDNSGLLEPGKSNIQLIYVLYILGFVVGITPLIGLILAYLNRGKAGGWIESHYTWAIRTFWIGILFSIISVILTFLIIGIIGFIATAVWTIVRCIIGLQKAGRGEPIADPQSWLI
jgi:uncharacterized membrane protein